jgi:hypothetical protein
MVEEVTGSTSVVEKDFVLRGVGVLFDDLVLPFQGEAAGCSVDDIKESS